MRTTQLYIKVADTWREIDLFDNITIPLTFKVSEIRNFGSKTSGFSLDFDIPHTNNNSQVFGLNVDINTFNSTFEVGRDYPAYLTDSGLTTFSGQLRLKKVIKKNNGAYIYYVGYLFGGAKNFIDELGNQTLTANDNPDNDLSFSEYSLTAAEFTINEIRNRLTNLSSTATGFGFTFIDKNNKAAQPFTSSAQQWYTNEVTPYLFVTEILNKIFEKTNYNYVSEFLTNGNYLTDSRWNDTIGQYNTKKMIYPFVCNNAQLSTLGTPESLYVTQATNSMSLFFGYEIFPTNASLFPFLEFSDITTNPNTFTYSKPQVSQYQILNWQPSRDGKYKVNVSLPFKMGLMFAYYYFDYGWQQVKFTYSSASVNAYTYPLEATFQLCTKRNGQEIILNEQSITWQLTDTIINRFAYEHWGNNYSVSVLGADDWTGTYTISNEEMLLKSTDILYLKIYSVVPYTDNGLSAFYADTPELGQNTRLSGAPRIYSTGQAVGTEIMSFVQVDEFAENQPFDPTVILNPKTKKTDFVNNLIKSFNLYIEDVSNKKNYSTGGIYAENTLRIEPYEIYYTPELGAGQTNVKDWTNKIDWETVEYRRNEEILYTTQKFEKLHENDYFTAEYNNTYKLPYGDYYLSGQYCTNDETNEIKVNNGAYICGLVNDQTQTAQVPKIFSFKKNGSEIDTNKEYSDSIFFAWFNDMYNQIYDPSFFMVRSSVTPLSTILIYEYWCCDTLNNGYGTATADLNFTRSSEYLQQMNGANPTSNTLFNAFYSKQYDEFSAPDSRLMKCKLFLSAYDIATLQMSDTIIINGDIWHIAEINQWKNGREAVEAEFIKATPNPPITETIEPIIDDEPITPKPDDEVIK